MKYRLLFLFFLFAWCYSCVNVTEDAQLEGIEEFDFSEDVVLSRASVSGLAAEMNRFLELVDLNEFRMIDKFAMLYDTVFNIFDLRQKWYESILRTNQYAARVYKSLRIDSGYKRSFKNDEELAAYLKEHGVPEIYYSSVVRVLVNSGDKLNREITQELERLKEENRPVRPSEPDKPSEPKPIRYTLSETIKEARRYWGSWEEVGKVGDRGILSAPLDQFDFIDVACLVDNYNRQNLYTYNNFAFSTPRKAEGFQAIMKIVNDRENLILLEVRVHHEDSHTIYLYVIDARTNEIYDRLEVAVYYWHDFNDLYETEADSRRFLVKHWMFKDDYKIVVGELKTDVAAKFNEDFGTLEAEVIHTTYKYNVNTNEFVQVEQKSVGRLQYDSENIDTNISLLNY